MENKKLVKILLKDMTELEEMIAETKTKGDFDALEMEIIHTRAKSILQLLQLLKGMEQSVIVPEAPVQKITENKPQEIETLIENVPVKEEVQKLVDEEIEQLKEEPEEEIQEKESMESKIEIEEKKEADSEKQDIEIETKIEKEETEEVEKSLVETENEDVELEEEELVEANQRLGDSFLKGKSVNDILTDQNKLEFKLSNRPVLSIQTAIGINDRFQYIRELFDGSAETFTQTVTDLDGLNNINEAVKYLQKNFKWKKNETSLKFVNLVKRRFPNE
jgi:hypothetical protein